MSSGGNWEEYKFLEKHQGERHRANFLHLFAHIKDLCHNGSEYEDCRMVFDQEPKGFSMLRQEGTLHIKGLTRHVTIKVSKDSTLYDVIKAIYFLAHPDTMPQDHQSELDFNLRIVTPPPPSSRDGSGIPPLLYPPRSGNGGVTPAPPPSGNGGVTRPPPPSGNGGQSPLIDRFRSILNTRLLTPKKRTDLLTWFSELKSGVKNLTQTMTNSVNAEANPLDMALEMVQQIKSYEDIKAVVDTLASLQAYVENASSSNEYKKVVADLVDKAVAQYKLELQQGPRSVYIEKYRTYGELSTDFEGLGGKTFPKKLQEILQTTIQNDQRFISNLWGIIRKITGVKDILPVSKLFAEIQPLQKTILQEQYKEFRKKCAEVEGNIQADLDTYIIWLTEFVSAETFHGRKVQLPSNFVHFIDKLKELEEWIREMQGNSDPIYIKQKFEQISALNYEPQELKNLYDAMVSEISTSSNIRAFFNVQEEIEKTGGVARIVTALFSVDPSAPSRGSTVVADSKNIVPAYIFSQIDGLDESIRKLFLRLNTESDDKKRFKYVNELNVRVLKFDFTSSSDVQTIRKWLREFASTSDTLKMLNLFYYDSFLDIVGWNICEETDFDKIPQMSHDQWTEILTSAGFVPMLAFPISDPDKRTKVGFRPFRDLGEFNPTTKEKNINEIVELITKVQKLDSSEEKNGFIQHPYAAIRKGSVYSLVPQEGDFTGYKYHICSNSDGDVWRDRTISANTCLNSSDLELAIDPDGGDDVCFQYLETPIAGYKVSRLKTRMYKIKSLALFLASFLQPGKIYCIDKKEYIILNMEIKTDTDDCIIKYRELQKEGEEESVLRILQEDIRECNIKEFIQGMLDTMFKVDNMHKRSEGNISVLYDMKTFIGQYVANSETPTLLVYKTGNDEIRSKFGTPTSGMFNLFTVFRNLSTSDPKGELFRYKLKTPELRDDSAYIEFDSGNIITLGTKDINVGHLALRDRMELQQLHPLVIPKQPTVGVGQGTGQFIDESSAMPIAMPYAPPRMPPCCRCVQCQARAAELFESMYYRPRPLIPPGRVSYMPYGYAPAAAPCVPPRSLYVALGSQW